MLGNNSIVIPTDEDNLIANNSDPFILEYVLNTPDNEEKRLISFSLKPSEPGIEMVIFSNTSISNVFLIVSFTFLSR